MVNDFKILYLGAPTSEKILNFLTQDGIKLFFSDDFLKHKDIIKIDPDLIISFGYRHIIGEEIFTKYRTINLHISYLPYNRGSDPNFWSFLKNTPKGITIHEVDRGLDTGRIILQKKIIFDEEEDTLSKTYNRLKMEIENLFIKNWNDIKAHNYKTFSQNLVEGTFHKKKDLEKYWKLMPKGWETKIEEVACLQNLI